jgi:hypothetical protein
VNWLLILFSYKFLTFFSFFLSVQIAKAEIYFILKWKIYGCLFCYLPYNLQFFSLNNTVKRFDIKFLTKLSIFCHS